MIAVEARHGALREIYTYAQLGYRISIAAAAFRSYGIGEGDVVAIFSENSPRWLVADQGLMRVGAAAVSYTHLTLPTISSV